MSDIHEAAIQCSSNSDTLLKGTHGGEVTKLIEEDRRNQYEIGKFGNCSLRYASAGGIVDVLRHFFLSEARFPLGSCFHLCDFPCFCSWPPEHHRPAFSVIQLLIICYQVYKAV